MLLASLESLLQLETTLFYVGPLEQLIQDLGDSQAFISRHDIAAQIIPSFRELVDALRKLSLKAGSRPERLVVYGLERYADLAQLNAKQRVKLWSIAHSLSAIPGVQVTLADKEAHESGLASAISQRAGASFSEIYSQENRVAA